MSLIVKRLVVVAALLFSLQMQSFAEGNNNGASKPVSTTDVSAPVTNTPVEVEAVDEDVVVFPSRGGEMTIRINDTSKDVYTFELFNAAGEKVHAETVKHTSGLMIKTLQPSVVLPAGNYKLHIQKKKYGFKPVQVEVK
jgi:hypothetical protein